MNLRHADTDTKLNKTAFLSLIKLSKHTSVYINIKICIDWTKETIKLCIQPHRGTIG